MHKKLMARHAISLHGIFWTFPATSATATFTAETPLQDPIALGVTRRRHSGSLQGRLSNGDPSDLDAPPQKAVSVCVAIFMQKMMII